MLLVLNVLSDNKLKPPAPPETVVETLYLFEFFNKL